MKKTASARFSIKSWDEKPYSEGKDLPKMTRASVDKTFTGDLEGVGHVEYVMMYRSGGTAAFVGLERITGRIAGRSGSFVLQRTGVFEDGQAKESYSVVTGSGTGELRGLRRRGHLLGRSCGRLSLRVELRTGLDTRSDGSSRCSGHCRSPNTMRGVGLLGPFPWGFERQLPHVLRHWGKEFR